MYVADRTILRLSSNGRVTSIGALDDGSRFTVTNDTSTASIGIGDAYLCFGRKEYTDLDSALFDVAARLDLTVATVREYLQISPALAKALAA
jgi:hypothetical protein